MSIVTISDKRSSNCCSCRSWHHHSRSHWLLHHRHAWLHWHSWSLHLRHLRHPRHRWHSRSLHLLHLWWHHGHSRHRRHDHWIGNSHSLSIHMNHLLSLLLHHHQLLLSHHLLLLHHHRIDHNNRSRLNENDRLDIGGVKSHCPCLRHLRVLLHLTYKTDTLSLHLSLSCGQLVEQIIVAFGFCLFNLKV